MHDIDWSSVAVAAFLLVLTTRLSLVAIRYPEPNDDLPDFLPPEREGALIMLVLAIGAIVIAAKLPFHTIADRVIVIAHLLSGANMALVASVLFRIHRIKNVATR